MGTEEISKTSLSNGEQIASELLDHGKEDAFVRELP